MSRGVRSSMAGTPRCGVRTARRAVPTIVVYGASAMAAHDPCVRCDSVVRGCERTTRNTRDRPNHRIHPV